jgi:Flp pilus assembly CpaF family ATPase
MARTQVGHLVPLRIVRRLRKRLVGGLGFLDGLMPPASFAYTDVLVNGDGPVWGRRKGEMTFDALAHKPGREEVWRAVEALLSPQVTICTEATPSVDAKLPRDRSLGFGGARVKVLHPAISAGDGYHLRRLPTRSLVCKARTILVQIAAGVPYTRFRGKRFQVDKRRAHPHQPGPTCLST